MQPVQGIRQRWTRRQTTKNEFFSSDNINKTLGADCQSSIFTGWCHSQYPTNRVNEPKVTWENITAVRGIPRPWVLRWLSSVDFTVNSRLHISQRNGFSPVWMRTCRVRSLGFLKLLPHVEHLLGYFAKRRLRAFDVLATCGCDGKELKASGLPWAWDSSSLPATAEFKPSNCRVNLSDSGTPIKTVSTTLSVGSEYIWHSKKYYQEQLKNTYCTYIHITFTELTETERSWNRISTTVESESRSFVWVHQLVQLSEHLTYFWLTDKRCITAIT